MICPNLRLADILSFEIHQSWFQFALVVDRGWESILAMIWMIKRASIMTPPITEIYLQTITTNP